MRAVVGCQGEPKPHECPYDGAYHRHGAIHYWSQHSGSLTFHEGDWYWMCDEHYAVCVNERREFIARVDGGK